jgi:hypothetical protein
MKKKIDKDNSKKTMWGNTVATHNFSKKKIKKLNSQPAQ